MGTVKIINRTAKKNAAGGTLWRSVKNPHIYFYIKHIVTENE